LYFLYYNAHFINDINSFFEAFMQNRDKKESKIPTRSLSFSPRTGLDFPLQQLQLQGFPIQPQQYSQEQYNQLSLMLENINSEMKELVSLYEKTGKHLAFLDAQLPKQLNIVHKLQFAKERETTYNQLILLNERYEYLTGMHYYTVQQIQTIQQKPSPLPIIQPQEPPSLVQPLQLTSLVDTRLSLFTPSQSTLSSPFSPRSNDSQDKLTDQRDEITELTSRNCLSDHILQKMIFMIYGPRENSFATMGSTYNTQGKRYSQKSNRGRFSNNPWDIDECTKDYLNRKETQLLEISSCNGLGFKGLDFLCLQEADLFYQNFYVNGLSELEKKEFALKCMELHDDFKTNLETNGFQMIMLPSNKQKPLVTIYKSSIFTHLKSESILPNSHGFHCAMASHMVHNASGQEVVLINFHLTVGECYAPTVLLDAAEHYRKQSKIVLGAGDANLPPRRLHGLHSGINEMKSATNIRRLSEKDPSLSMYDDEGYPLCIDGFFAVPNSKTKISLQQVNNKCFSLNSKGKIVMSSNIHKWNQSSSNENQPCINKRWSQYKDGVYSFIANDQKDEPKKQLVLSQTK